MIAHAKLISLVVLASVPAVATAAPPSGPEIFAVTMYSVLPSGAIPAILEPSLASGKEAAAQMLPEEPVLGVVVGGRPAPTPPAS